MPELRLHQPARSNLLAPVLVAFLILGVVLALVIRYTPHRTADLELLKSNTYAAHTQFKSNSLVVTPDQSQDDLYVVTDIRITDRLNLPIFLKDFTATLVTSDGDTLNSSAVEKTDIENLFITFPALRPLVSQPLLRDTLIPSENSAAGTLIFHFQASKEMWEKRRTASVTVDFYHQSPLSITIPIDNSKSDAATEKEK